MAKPEQTEATPSRSNKLLQKGLLMTFLGGVGLAGGFVVGSIAGILTAEGNVVSGYSRSDAEGWLAENQTAFDQSVQRLSDVKLRIGEPCVRALTLYRSGDVLSDTPINDVVTDLLAEPGKPCGSTRSDVRYAAASLLDADRSVVDTKAWLASSKEDLELATPDEDLDRLDSIIGWSMAAGAALGMALGSVAAKIEQDSQDGKSIQQAS